MAVLAIPWLAELVLLCSLNAVQQQPMAGAPTCLGWDQEWIVYQLDVDKMAWKTWKSPPRPITKVKAWTTVGPTAAAVIEPGRQYGGWWFDLNTGAWKEIPILETAPAAVGGKNLSIAIVNDTLVVWSLTNGPLPPVGGPGNGAFLHKHKWRLEPLPEFPLKPRKAPIGAVVGKKLFLWGGYAAEFGPGHGREAFSDGALLDLTAHKWTVIAEAPFRRQYGMGSAVWGDSFVVFGGQKENQQANLEGAIYDPSTNKWERMTDCPFEIGLLPACAVSGDRLFAWSGCPANSDLTRRPVGAVYNFVTKEWKKIADAPIPGPGRCLCFTHAIGSKVVMWGGWDGYSDDTRFFKDGAIYDLDKDTWQKIPDLPGTIPYQLHPGW